MRSNTRDSATGVSVSISRARFVSADDSKMMQEAQVQVFHDEVHDGIERWQAYGHSAVPLPPDPNSPKSAEAIVAYLGGSRSHPVVLGVDDRRHRPKNGKPGEVLLYDDQGQQVYLTRNGIVITGGGSKLPVTVVVNNTKVVVADKKITVDPDDGGQVILGGDGKRGSYAPVQTTAGPSTSVIARYS